MLGPSLLSLLLVTGQPPSVGTVGDEFHANEPDFVSLRYDPGFLALFQEHSIQYTGGGYRDKIFRYRLFVPETAGPADKRPLLVWLHGKGTAGDDNISHVRHLSTLVLKQPWRREQYPFFVLAVQCPRDNFFWTTRSGDADDMLNVVVAILEKTIQEFPVDLNRISLTGVSSGGSGCWELAIRRPDLFAAVAPMASGGPGESRVNRLVDMPVWAFISTSDPGSSIEAVRTTVAALEAAGGSAHLTEVKSFLHDCSSVAFHEHHILDWLLSQKQGSSGRPPGTLTASQQLHNAWQRWSSLEIFGQVGIPVLVLFAIWSARRHRRLRRAQRGNAA